MENDQLQGLLVSSVNNLLGSMEQNFSKEEITLGCKSVENSLKEIVKHYKPIPGAKVIQMFPKKQ